jgi:hypothetical protein
MCCCCCCCCCRCCVTTACRGYTRKEPYANHLLGFNWTPRAENWNGRIAMLGFAGMVLTEWITGVNTLQAWGLQSVKFPGL